ncbi:MAG TPA: aldehyde dehydrogenase family protein [Kineosporiaceae bacterium]
MDIPHQTPSRSSGLATATFDTLDPATGTVTGTYPIRSEAAVRAAVGRARAEALWWADLGFDERGRHLTAWKVSMVERLPELVEIMRRETGKPGGDAMLEVTLAIDHLAWAAGHAKKVLGRRRVPAGLLMLNQSASVAYKPLGVIGVIGPWNYPVFTPLGSIAYALAAGNAVVFKPSEYTPGVGVWIADRFEEAVGRPVLQAITGLGATGSALCRAGVDKIAFTGSTATGKRVMAACADTLTPVVIEAGGKDSLIVDADADIPAAADAAVWGAFSNAGQTCIGVERVYVHEKVYDAFVDALTAKARHLQAGADGKIGPITMPSQLNVIRSHVQDALDKGGRAVVGGLHAVGERYVQPIVLLDVPEDSLAVQQETFGPTVTVTKVRDMNHAVELTNATPYGLGNTVFSRRSGMAVAERIRSGMSSVNSVISFAGIPSLPFGGVGDSGFGRIHGADGLKEFTYAKAIARQRFRPLLTLTTFERSARADRLLAKALRLVHGGRPRHEDRAHRPGRTAGGRPHAR